jgi:uncharacterized protein YkwD
MTHDKDVPNKHRTEICLITYEGNMKSLYAIWYSSPAHREAMLNESYSNVALAVRAEFKGGQPTGRLFAVARFW